MRRFSSWLMTLFASRAFFMGILAFFVAQALWFVFSAVYPMAFDEEVHVGIIRMYSDYWLPILNSQPPTNDVFGAVIADPSYLYHYLMSFPYRLLTMLTASEAAQIIVLRLINVALFAYSLVIFRRVLRETGRSPAFSNVALAIFTLIPIAPMLAAHVNYDNLMMVCVAWLLLLGVRLVAAAQQRIVAVDIWVWFIIVALAGIATKYVLLPLVLVAGLFLVAYTLWCLRGNLVTAVQHSWKALPRRTVIVLFAVLLLAIGFGLQRYGANVARYGMPLPACEVVLDESRCAAFGPWNRNNQLAQAKGEFNTNPLYYTKIWTVDMYYRMFFAVAGPGNTYATRIPLLVPIATAAVLSVVSLVALAFAARYLRSQPQLLFLLLPVAAYFGALWFDNYSQYLETGKAVAVNGRYLLPGLLPLAAVFGWAWSRLPLRTAVKPLLAAGVLVLMLNGGGVLTYIYRSEPSWYWNNGAIRGTNEIMRDITRPFVIDR